MPANSEEDPWRINKQTYVVSRKPLVERGSPVRLARREIFAAYRLFQYRHMCIGLHDLVHVVWFISQNLHCLVQGESSRTREWLLLRGTLVPVDIFTYRLLLVTMTFFWQACTGAGSLSIRRDISFWPVATPVRGAVLTVELLPSSLLFQSQRGYYSGFDACGVLDGIGTTRLHI